MLLCYTSRRIRLLQILYLWIFQRPSKLLLCESMVYLQPRPPLYIPQRISHSQAVLLQLYLCTFFLFPIFFSNPFTMNFVLHLQLHNLSGLFADTEIICIISFLPFHLVYAVSIKNIFSKKIDFFAFSYLTDAT